MTQQENKSLTSIRGVAALWVLGYHAAIYFFNDVGPQSLGLGAFRFGYTAVDVFFILSGFILYIAYPQLSQRKLPSFFIKRLFRIYPLHLTVLLFLGCAVALQHFLGQTLRYPDHYSTKAFIQSLFLVQPFFSHSAVWNGPAWSLSVEAFCYLAFPLLLMLFARLTTQLKVCLFLVVASLEYWAMSQYGDAIFGVAAAERGILGFTFGMLLCGLWATRIRVAPLICTMVESFSFAAIIICSVCKLPSLIPFAGALLILALSWGTGKVSHLLSNVLFHRLGEISLSIYLIHVPLMIFSRSIFRTVAAHASLNTDTSLYRCVSGVLFLCLVVSLSECTFRLIEQPGRRFGKRLAARSVPSVRGSFTNTQVLTKQRQWDTIPDA